MRPAQIEHVNYTVADPKRTAQTLVDLFGWHVRWEGPARGNGYTVHVGTEDAYLALYANGTRPGMGRLNHVGVMVDDLEGAEQRVLAAGLEPYSHEDYAPGRRFYFRDDEGVEYEVVSYA